MYVNIYHNRAVCRMCLWLVLVRIMSRYFIMCGSRMYRVGRGVDVVGGSNSVDL